MQVQNISFGRFLYPHLAKGVMPQEQFDYLDKISTATNTDVMVTPDSQNKNKHSAMIFLDDKRGIVVNAKGGVGIGDILSRVYAYALIGNIDLLSARRIVNKEILYPKKDGLQDEQKRKAALMLSYIYAGLANEGRKISDEGKKLDKVKLVEVPEEYIKENFPEIAEEREKRKKEVDEVRELCAQNGIEIRESSCVIYDDNDELLM